MPHLKIKIAYSSAFFMLFVFSTLSLIVSQFSSSFTRLFMIFARNGHMYDFFTNILYFIGFCISMGFLVYGSQNRNSSIPHKILMLFLAIIFVFLFIFSVSQNFTSEDVLNSLISNIGDKDFFTFRFYADRVLVCSFIYIFFVALPLISSIFHYHPNSLSPLGEFLESIRPSQNIIIIALFSCSFQPYFFKDSIFGYIDFISFVAVMALFVRNFVKGETDYGFYEYANLLILLVGILIFLLTSSMLSEYDDYFNARYSFMVLVFVSWCSEWMAKSAIPSR